MDSRLSEPDVNAVRRVLSVAPALRRLVRAGEALGLGRHELLHAGPPIGDAATACAPIANSAITAILFEGWARNADEARALLRSGDVHLRPAQDRGCVVPLADVVSSSMWLQEIGDSGSPESLAWSPLNGGGEHALRVGVFGEDVLERLRWINGPFVESYRLVIDEPVALLDLADTGIQGGDDCHGQTAVATSTLASMLEDRWSGADAEACRAFLRRSPGFFLNVWMAASKCMLDAARGIEEASVVVAAGGNGHEFGIQFAARPGVWFTVHATPPHVAPGGVPTDAVPLGAIGDSAIVDYLGLGAMTTPSIGNDRPAPFADVLPQADGVYRSLLAAAHPGFARTRPRMVIPIRRMLETRQAPVVSLGVLDAAGVRGRLAGGYYQAPFTLFERLASEIAG